MAEPESEPDLMDIVEAYVDRFGDGPPIFEMEDSEAIAQMKLALATGEPMREDQGRGAG